MDAEHTSEELDEWQLIPTIPSSSSMDKAQWLSNNETLVIKDDFFSESSVFPPTNHQGLAVDEETEPLYSALSSSSSSSSSSYDEEDEIKVEANGVKSEVAAWRRMVVSAWWSRVVQAARDMKKYAVCRIGLWCSLFATTGVLSMVLISLWCMRVQKWRRRLQMRTQRIEHLMLVIKEREQKIDKLLLQIAHMNEMLLARQKVTVLRVR